MDKGWRQKGHGIAGFAAVIAFASAAVAAPPPGPTALNEFRGAGRDNVASRQSAISKLDLRAPTSFATASDVSAKPLAGGVPFPSARRPVTDAPVTLADRRSADARLENARLESTWPLGGDGLPMARPMSPAQEMARRFQREGLPVARLFESHAALVSLGLNQHGKPGLWLIQKLP